MRYFNTHTGTPMPDWRIKSEYGINPAAPEARERGFYPLIESPADTTASHYIKEGDHYKAVPLPITNSEMAAVNKLRKAGGVEFAAKQLIPDWDNTTAYKPGELVEHRGAVYRKADDTDNSEPDDVAGGWLLAT